MSTISVMTIVPIATQKPMYEYVGQLGCQFYWGANIAFGWVMATTGVGMATFRLICFHYLFKKEINAKKIAKNILLGELVLTVVMMSLVVFLFMYIGWEKALFYQYCMNMGHTESKTIHEYNQGDDQLGKSYRKGLRLAVNSFGQALVIAEMIIYGWILYNLWKHDKENHSKGIITETMKKERKQKNAITLFGQIASFFVETAFNIYTMIHMSNLSLVEASFMPISQIVASTVISAIQLASSHEMRRFVKNQFNLY